MVINLHIKPIPLEGWPRHIRAIFLPREASWKNKWLAEICQVSRKSKDAAYGYDPWQSTSKQREKRWRPEVDMTHGHTHSPAHTHTDPQLKKSFTQQFPPLQHIIPSDIFYFIYVISNIFFIKIFEKPYDQTWQPYVHSLSPNRLNYSGLGFCHLNCLHFPTQPLCALKAQQLKLCVKLCNLPTCSFTPHVLCGCGCGCVCVLLD